MGHVTDQLDGALVLFPNEVFLFDEVKQMKRYCNIERVRINRHLSSKQDLTATCCPLLENHGTGNTLFSLEGGWESGIRDDFKEPR
jgi:hypothetical protein